MKRQSFNLRRDRLATITIQPIQTPVVVIIDAAAVEEGRLKVEIRADARLRHVSTKTPPCYDTSTPDVPPVLPVDGTAGA